ncbi:MAG: ABC transporter permease [Lachnospiraceae bacterium]|nr:ABC transporter permease [Lachnospiraceae bacterium]
MSRLLYANFMRLKHDTCFRICLLVMAAIGGYTPYGTYSTMQKYMAEDYVIPLENAFLPYIPLTVILSAAFCSLFIGTEFSDGTIRNKLMVGHLRTRVYLANLIVCFAAACMLSLAYIVPNLCMGILLLGFFRCGLEVIVFYAGCAVVLFAAVTAIYTIIAMLSQNRAVTAVLCTLGIVFMIFYGAYINARLAEPEVYEGYVYVNEEIGIYEEVESMPNPHYIDGKKRVIYEFLNDFLPGNQTAVLWQGMAVHLPVMSLYSCIITIAVTGAGMICFQKEDIK